MVTMTIEDQRALIFEFMKAIVTCHEVVCDSSDIKNKIKY